MWRRSPPWLRPVARQIGAPVAGLPARGGISFGLRERFAGLLTLRMIAMVGRVEPLVAHQHLRFGLVPVIQTTFFQCVFQRLLGLFAIFVRGARSDH